METRSDTQHTAYCRKLQELGKALRYDTEIPKTELYHLAYPDAAWYVDTQVGFDGVPEKVPVAVFEVLSSELEKAIRGSVSSLLLYGSPIGVLVMITDRYEHLKKSKTAEDWKRYIRDLVRALGLERRVFLWDEKRVDWLLDKYRTNQPDQGKT